MTRKAANGDLPVPNAYIRKVTSAAIRRAIKPRRSMIVGAFALLTQISDHAGSVPRGPSFPL